MKFKGPVGNGRVFLIDNELVILLKPSIEETITLIKDNRVNRMF